MASATDFLPDFITILMKRAISWLPCFGSGRTTRAGWEPLRDIILVLYSALRALGAVLRARLATLGHAGAVETAANRVVTHTREILDATAADQNDRVFLKIVTFATDVADDFETVGQAHLGNLTQCRVRLLRSGRIHARANTAALRAALQGRRGALVRLRAAGFAHQLVDCRHAKLFLRNIKADRRIGPPCKRFL